MNFRQLRYFVRIAELGNMTRASAALHIAQPALSAQMASLEAQLGTRLFDRSAHGVRLTASGHSLMRRAVPLLRQLQEARDTAASADDQPAGKVSLGIPGSTAKMLAVPLVRRVAAHGAILLEMVERPSAELVGLVAAGQLDMAIAVDAAAHRGAIIAPLLREELFVVLPPGAAGARRRISMAQLSAQPMLLPGAPSTIRLRVDAALLNAQLPCRLVAEVGNTDMLLRLVRAGLGWTVLPWSAVAQEVHAQQLLALPLAGQVLRRELSLCVSDAVPLSPAGQWLRDAVLALVQELGASGQWKGSQFDRACVWQQPAMGLAGG